MIQQLSTLIGKAYDIFMLDNRARRFTPKTMEFYRCQLQPFFCWCTMHGVDRLQDVTPSLIRSYLVSLQDRELSDCSINAGARAIRAFCNFCVREELIDRSPMAKVSMPRISKRILPAFSADEVRKLLEACGTVRDKAIVLFLLDTGCRASELIALTGADVDTDSGEVYIRQGKGRKDRTTYLGVKSRRYLLRYYLCRQTPLAHAPLWLNEKTDEPLTVSGLNQLLKRLGWRAQIKHCSPHTFRRTFALWSLRNGMNIYVLARLMGHADITVLRQYLPLIENDLQEAHAKFGAVDNLFG